MGDSGKVESILDQIDHVLADHKVGSEAKALLLLKVCQVGQALSFDGVDSYWEQLEKLSGKLPAAERVTYRDIKEARTPSNKGDAKVPGLLERVNSATEAAAANPGQSGAAFRNCESEISKQLWPFGKSAAWTALLQAWAEVDRPAALALIGRLRKGARKNVLSTLNRKNTLAPQEWEIAYKSGGGAVVDAVVELLDEDDPALVLPGTLAKSVGNRLLPDLHVVSATPEKEKEFENRRKKAYNRFLNVISCVADQSPETAHDLVKSAVDSGIKTNRFAEAYHERFSYMRQILNVWSRHQAGREKALAFIKTETPAYLRDFMLSHWYAMVTDTAEDGPTNWKRLESDCEDVVLSEAWYLVTLVRRGFPETAMKLAQTSPRASSVVPRIRRAWLCEHPQSGATAIKREDLAGDLVGEFLLLGSPEERMEFLRAKTNKGTKGLPKELWDAPSASLLTHEDKVDARPSELGLYVFVWKSLALDQQFKQQVRANAYGQYSHEEVDRYLLSALVAWDEAHPDEVDKLMPQMMQVMRPDDTTLSLDLLRNSAFERCQNVMSAKPEAYSKLFVQWVKKKLVDSSVTRYEGSTVYTFSLKSFVPSFYCLLGAQEVARVSAERCDKLIGIGISDYAPDSDVVGMSARLYASDKGLKGIHPPVEMKQPDLLSVWQRGVVEVSYRRIVEGLISVACAKEGHAAEPDGALA